jgi:ectoine hydroxylase
MSVVDASQPLTHAERERFEADGFLMIDHALGAAEVERFRTVAEQAFAAFREGPGTGAHSILNQHDLIGRDDAYLDLVDVPTTFPKVWGVLGWNIQLFHTQLVVTPPTDPAAPRGGYAWHQDNNRMNLDFDTPPPHPRVSVKVGYFLTDLPGPAMGNFCVVPGSHRRGRPHLELHEQPPDAIEITARAGDAILFDRRLWHAASTNHSTVTRIALFYGYSYRWLRPKSAMHLPELVARRDPIRRQLLGAATSANGYFDPTDDDVPLRAWIRQYAGDDALAP